MNHVMEKALTAEPHLGPYVEAGDVDLEHARKRWDSMQGRMQAALVRAGTPIRVRHHAHGLTTTSIKSDSTVTEEDTP
jgi:hypothetical protein